MRRVLVVDDDRAFADALREQLEEQGYAVSVVHDEAGLGPALEGPPAHVVLLDIRLDGPGWSERDGVDLVPRVLGRWPTSRILVVSGFLDAKVVARAYDGGATDLLDKSGPLVELLRHKVRLAAEAAERDWLRHPPERERELRECWTAARTVSHGQRKGELLERTIKLLFGSVPGMVPYQSIRNVSQEIDVLVWNESSRPFLAAQGTLWLVECKNWSSKAGVAALHPLTEKMRTRWSRCKLGFLVSMNGFASTVDEERLTGSTGDLLMVLIDALAIDAWIDAADRESWLVERIQAAVSR